MNEMPIELLYWMQFIRVSGLSFCHRNQDALINNLNHVECYALENSQSNVFSLTHAKVLKWYFSLPLSISLSVVRACAVATVFAYWYNIIY